MGHYDEPKPHHKEPEPHPDPPPSHYDEPNPHHKEPKPHHKEPEPHYEVPPSHYDEPKPHHKESEPHPAHYKDPEPHHEPHPEHYEEPEPHHKPHPSHYEEPETSYKEPEPHHEPHPGHYEEPETNYKEPEPHHEPPPSHFEKPKPHHQPHPSHYKDPKPHPKPHPIHYDPKPSKPDLDPHAKEKQCVDVSTYSYPTWVKKDKQCCKTEFKKVTYQKTKTVCTNVTSLYCDVWPYTECEMKMYDKKLTLSHWEYEFKPVYKCVKRYENIIHKKEKPKCTKKPKKVCNSKWKLLPSGKKVWAGNEDCKTIYVDNCILETVPVSIKVEKPVCSVVKKIPFMTIVPKKEIKTVYKMTCKVLKKNHCEAHTTKECKEIKYIESTEKPHKTCDPTYIKVPKQVLEHKKKCLFMAHDGLNHETYKLT